MLRGQGTRPKDEGDDDALPDDEAIDEYDRNDDEDMDDDDEEEEEDAEGMDSGDDGSDEGMDDDELEAALSTAGKSGVDRELLRKLIGGGSDSDSEAPAPRAPMPQGVRPLASQAERFEYDSMIQPPSTTIAPKDSDPYDSYVRLLALEPRAHATDRLKTPLELAKDAAKELEVREEKRLRRQRGELSDDSGDEGSSKKKKKSSARKPQGDDLEDDFLDEQSGDEFDDEDAGLGKGLEGGFGHQVIEDQSADEEEEEEDEGEEEEDVDEDEEDMVGDIEEPSDDEEVDASAPEALVSALVVDSAKSRTWGGKDVKPELPFTFPCPSTHAEFANLLSKSGVADADTAVVVKRIRVLYHPGLGPDNKAKLQTFTNVLLDHVLHLASSPSPTTYLTINSLLPQLLTLSHAFPLTTAPYYIAKLSLMQKNFTRGVARGVLDPTSKTWPGEPELTLLRLVGMIWSTSDLSHPVVAASMLLMSQYLSQSRVRTLGDIASGLFLCTLAGQFEKSSKRLVPEAANFLLNSFLLLVPTSVTARTIPGSFPSPDFGHDRVRTLRLRTTDDLQPKLLHFTSSLVGVATDTQLKVDLVSTTIALLKDLAQKYVSLDAFIELFKPIEVILERATLTQIPPSIRVRPLPSSICTPH